MKRKPLLLTTITAVVSVVLFAAVQVTAQSVNSPQPVIRIAIANLDAGGLVRNDETIPAGTDVQITVTTNGVDCAGHLVVTALGAPGAPPATLVQTVPFILGPAVGNNAVTGSPLDAGVLPTGRNDFKVSATCNGAGHDHFSVAESEFLVQSG